jgi:proteic killer suppression protein
VYVKTNKKAYTSNVLTRVPIWGYDELVDIFAVEISKNALKDLEKVPRPILDKLQSWIEAIEIEGLREVRKLSGFHDEPLKGKRKGQRSIRLNRAYRAIYTIQNDKIEFVLIEEVNKHDY